MRRVSSPRSGAFLLASLAFAAMLVSAGCGYALAGRGSFLPESIKIIGIPTFANRTQVFNLETQITEKVRSEFIGRGRYTIVPESSGADALLTGEVTSVSITPINISPGQLATQYVIAMTARVELRDSRDNKVLWENPGLSFREEFNPQTGQTTVDPAAFFGQDANALERMTTSLASTIVSAILEAF